MLLEVYKDHRKILIRLRDRALARFEAAKDKRKVKAEVLQAEALTTAILVMDNEIEVLRAVEARERDRKGLGKH